MRTYRLQDVAAVIRSKNSGPFELTFDIIFQDEEFFAKVVDQNIFTKETFSHLFKLRISDVISVIHFHPARAIKVTIIRPLPSGSIGERDVYGAQQHGPLMDFSFSLEI